MNAPADDAAFEKWPEELGAEVLARRFHELYERIAPQFGYRTRKGTRVPWSELPDDNRELMLLVSGKIIEEIVSPREAGVVIKATAKGFESGRSSLAQRLADAESTLADTLKALHDATERERTLADENAKLREAAAKVLEGFEQDIFIRNTAGDGRSDWAVKFLPYALALGTLSRAIAATDKQEGE